MHLNQLNLYFFSILQLICFSTTHGNLNCDPPPIIREGRTNALRNQSYPVGTLLPYQCNMGYNFIIGNENLARCVTNGTHASWHLNINCEPVSCGNPGDIENGRRLGENWTHPNSVEYICDEGFVLDSKESPFVRHCQASREWSNFLPICLIVNCSIPENLPDGSTELYGVTYGSQVIYDCGSTRKLEGNAVRECQKNGEWTGSAPRCVDLECDYPQTIYPFGTVQMLAGVNLNDKILYKCDDGTITEAQCFHPGIWAPPPVKCLTGLLTTTSTTRIFSTSTMATSVYKGVNSKRKNIFCRWKIFKWICDYFNKNKERK